MATLSVLRFSEATLAEAALPALRKAEQSRAITLEDAALISWQPSSLRPTIRQLTEVPTARPLASSFWQLFFGAALLLPIAARALGEPSTAACSLALLGISDRFVRDLRASLVGGTSALVLLTGDATADRVVAALRELDYSLISTNLTRLEQGTLLAVFGPLEAPPGAQAPSPRTTPGR